MLALERWNGSKKGKQICQQIGVKYCRLGAGGVQNIEKFAEWIDLWKYNSLYAISKNIWLYCAIGPAAWLASTISWPIWIRGHSQTTLTRFWLFLTTYPHVWTFSMVCTLTKSGHFWITYLPHLVNVVCECPLRWHIGILGLVMFSRSILHKKHYRAFRRNM